MISQGSRTSCTHKHNVLLLSLVLSLLLNNLVLVSSFVVGNTASNRNHGGAQSLTRVRASSVPDTGKQVDRLLELVDVETVDVKANDKEIQSVVLSLSEQDNDDQNVNFTAVLGNYNVTHVIPSKPNEKPVGGKWSRGPAQALLKTRRQLQHLLAPKRTNSVAEAVNVISMSALGDSFRIHVILRGDAFPVTRLERQDIVQKRQISGGLSPRTVRADFDPPRIVVARGKFSLLNLSVGPPSSVVLDTPYCDERIRIGKGSRGSWFIFKPCFDDEANEWKGWVAQRPVRKSKALAVLTATLGIGFAGLQQKGLWRISGAVLSTVSLLCGAVIAFSTGGIEQDDNNEA
mmetsp:Transcript_15635/g.28257  ORF Transcript_15635/g.28257 Transcript_15635/m.28257 type:complete len:346 (-) Transcript_15635:312-1349(-)